MLYLIQENLYREFHQENLIQTLDRLGLKYKMVKLQYFVDDIIMDPIDTKNVMIFGAVKAAHLAKKHNWNPGSFLNENHDYAVYSQYWKENMLNWDSKVQKLTDPIEIDGPFFARPTGDTKLFKGEIYESRDLWNFSLSCYLANNKDAQESMIQVASPKNILQEYRCFIVKGKVVTASMYKLGYSIIYKECVDEDIINFANDMCQIYQPADAFVMDVCRTNSGLKIVETNCINCAGLYDINIQKLINSLEENFND